MAREEPHARAADLPPALTATLAALIGNEVDALRAALKLPPPTSIRLNRAKGFAPTAEQVAWCAQGRYLHERPAFTFDPMLHAGAYYVQEASSMLLEQAVRTAFPADRDVLALDLCAAPGGKTTHLLDLLSPGSFVLANEVSAKRRSILAENLWKWGHPGVAITGRATEALERLQGTFDLVLLDAPCSGEGMFRKDPFAREQWSEALVRQCATTQRGLVSRAWNALAPGGVLIYSTCTWEPGENEAQLAALIEEGGTCLDLPMAAAWGVERVHGEQVIAYRCYPHRVRGEGFFIGLVRKPGVAPARAMSPAREQEAHSAGQWLTDERNSLFTEQDGTVFAAPAAWSATIADLQRALPLEAPGIPVAERKGDDRRPHPALALSTLLARDAFPEVELDLPGALQFLRGLSIPARAARGTALAVHRGLPLGWLQGAGNRWNNRWPAPWRIRAHSPSAPPVSWATDVDR